MEKSIAFSFIIPHKNTPDLLQKCLDSIPRRDDVQIIVVDDNSDADKVDFDNFPGLYDSSVEVYLTKEGKGAGYARNVGLKHAVGKWLVFADADDFFNPCINTALDLYAHLEYDVVFFLGNSISLPNGDIAKRGESLNIAIEKARKTSDYTEAILLSIPWRKFIRRSLVVDNQISFNEVKYGNDVVFMGKVASVANELTSSSLCIYCATEHDGSLIKAHDLDSLLIRFNQECENVKILRHSKYKKVYSIYYWLFYSWFNIYKQNRARSIILLPKLIAAGGWRIINTITKIVLE